MGPSPGRRASDAAEDVALKDPKDFTLIGKSLKRLDTPHKANGDVVYGIDVMLPGMKFATLAQVPCSAAKWATSMTATPKSRRATR